MNTKFTELGLKNSVLSAIETMNFIEPSKIQKEIIPLILNHFDVIGQAQTGTGKTLAYAASILSILDTNVSGVQAIILTPTRELALQVSEEFEKLNSDNYLKVLSVYGGSRISDQIRALKKGVQIVVGTPGRVMDLMKQKALSLQNLRFFILDEADEMLNMGFLEDIESIFKQTNSEKQVLLFSATMPKAIEKLAKRYMQPDYQHITIEEISKTSINVKQSYYLVNEKTKGEALARILDVKDPNLAIIFCKTKKDVDSLFTELSSKGYSVEAMHGDIAQSMRIQTLDRFKKGLFKCLIATDVAARGIHVDHIDCVINYSLPQDIESYIHRIGRTGRASNKGEAISLVGSRDLKLLREIEKFANCTIEVKELPLYEHIFESRCQKVLARIQDIVENKEQEAFLPYVRDMNKDELIKFSAALLKITVDQEIGSDFKKDISAPIMNERKRSSSSAGRVFLTIGSMDGITKNSLLDFLSKVTNLGRNCFQKIEILPKFTFLNIDSKVVDKAINKIHNQKFNNRIIHIEKAKKR